MPGANARFPRASPAQDRGGRNFLATDAFPPIIRKTTQPGQISALIMTTDSFPRPTMARRDFLKAAGSAAASVAVLSDAVPGLAQETPKTVTLAFVGCAHIHTPGFVNCSRPGTKDVKVK